MKDIPVKRIEGNKRDKKPANGSVVLLLLCHIRIGRKNGVKNIRQRPKTTHIVFYLKTN